MRYILIILVFLSLGANAQMVIKAHVNYRPYAQPAANLLLDDYPNAAAAYSLRKLDKDYTGAAIRVRKDTTGQPEQDIGFTASGDLDTSALKSFLNARSGFVTTWYDQSWQGRNASQATQANQPRIALNGVIDRRSGDLALVYDGTNDYLENTTNGFSVNNVSHYAVSSRGNDADAFRTIYSTGILAPLNGFGFFYSLTSAPDNVTQNRIYQQIRNLSLSAPIVGDYTNTINANNLIFGIGASSADTTYFNGANQKTTSHTRGNVTSTGRIIIGARWDGGFTYSFYLNGTTSEIVFWNSNQSSNRTGIENNINDYYNIYWNGDFTGILDTYPNSAAAYSLRNLSSTYKGPLIRVRKDTTGQPEIDVYGDYFGNLDTVGLKNFLLTRSGFVTTWYDQSGNNRTATQTTAANQPDIAVLGVIRRDINNLPTINFNGGSNRLNADTLLADQFEGVNQTLSVFSVNRPSLVDQRRVILAFAGNELTGTSNDRIQFGISSDLTEGLLVIRTTVNTNKIITSSPNTIGVNTNKILSWIKTSGNGTVYVNNNAGTAASQTNEALTLRHATLGASIRGSDNAIADYYAGRMAEVIIWNTDQTSNRTGIMTNINTYYAIY